MHAPALTQAEAQQLRACSSASGSRRARAAPHTSLARGALDGLRGPASSENRGPTMPSCAVPCSRARARPAAGIEEKPAQKSERACMNPLMGDARRCDPPLLAVSAARHDEISTLGPSASGRRRGKTAPLELDGNGGAHEELQRVELRVDAELRLRRRLRGLDEHAALPGAPGLGAPHPEALQQLHRHDLLLDERELLADAAPGPGREGHVGAGVRRPGLPPLGDEAGRVGPPGLRVQVQGEDVDEDGRPALDPPAAPQEQVVPEGHALVAGRGGHEAQGLPQAPVQVGQLRQVPGLQLAGPHDPLDLGHDLRLDARVGEQEHGQRGHGGRGRVVAGEEEGQDLAADVLGAELRAALPVQHDVEQVRGLPRGPRLPAHAPLDDVVDDRVHPAHRAPHLRLGPEAHPPQLRGHADQVEQGVDRVLEGHGEGVRGLGLKRVEVGPHAAARDRVQRHLHQVLVDVDRLPPGRVALQGGDQLVRLLAHQRDKADDAPVGEGPRQDLVGCLPLGVEVLREEQTAAEDLVDDGVEGAAQEGLAVAAARLVVLPQHLLHQLRIPQADALLAKQRQAADAVARLDALQDPAADAVLEAVRAELPERLDGEVRPLGQLHGGRRLASGLLPQGAAQQDCGGDSRSHDAHEAQDLVLGVRHRPPAAPEGPTARASG
eukprot:CAMPEP_0171243834 /NCGR_PEP_ID=MMETSP0790-20130122/46508_1 /TAXON_ID=2925 /ORGANISM="Alexandrium catenella, Strain OF101" /LENGTH=664 /DNA_ID=CAMNT_0011710873 /DNA_START=85 /DNA_END=2077 /DNA_ORIENTATION=+